MQINAYQELKKDQKMWDLLKTNSFWIKQINRNPNMVKAYKNEMKVKYHLRTTDKISDAIDNIDIISNVLNALK